MKRTAVSVLLSVLLVTACSGNGGAEPEAVPSPSASIEGEATASAAPTIPRPSAEQEATLLSEIEKINPQFVNEKTVDNARNQCTSILGGAPEANLVSAVKTRFEGAGVTAVSDTEAAQLLDAIRANGFCK